jgi:hypothetical protein
MQRLCFNKYRCGNTAKALSRESVMSISSVSAGSAQSQVQLELLRKANDMQADQAAQLLQAQAQAQLEIRQQVQQTSEVPPVTPGQPGGVINTFA